MTRNCSRLRRLRAARKQERVRPCGLESLERGAGAGSDRALAGLHEFAHDIVDGGDMVWVHRMAQAEDPGEERGAPGKAGRSAKAVQARSQDAALAKIRTVNKGRIFWPVMRASLVAEASRLPARDDSGGGISDQPKVRPKALRRLPPGRSSRTPRHSFRDIDEGHDAPPNGNPGTCRTFAERTHCLFCAQTIGFCPYVSIWRGEG
jgi:hypothetical protein